MPDNKPKKPMHEVLNVNTTNPVETRNEPPPRSSLDLPLPKIGIDNVAEEAIKTKNHIMKEVAQ